MLDAGTGTGLVAKAISPLVSKVIGIDTSLDMLANCQVNGNVHLMHNDIRKTRFQDAIFDKITGRNIFHHIIKDTQKAMNECYRLLKKNGTIIIGERMPPSDELKKEYSEIFKLKDERIIFVEKDLIYMMTKAGFKYIVVHLHWIKNISIRGWLENSDLPKNRQDRIFDLHVNGSDILKKAYNMRITKDDCFIDIKNLVLVGEKREV